MTKWQREALDRELDALGADRAGSSQTADDMLSLLAQIRAADWPDRGAGQRIGTRVATALGLDPIAVSAAAPPTFRDLQRICSFCERPRRCLGDLARDPAIPAWKDYCPNTKTLMALHAKGQHGIPTRGAFATS